MWFFDTTVGLASVAKNWFLLPEKAFSQCHVSGFPMLYEKQYNESLSVQSVKQSQIGEAKDNPSALAPPAPEEKVPDLQSKTSTAEQDLDVFLLGDLGSSDEDRDVGDDGFDDDFDKIGSNSRSNDSLHFTCLRWKSC